MLIKVLYIHNLKLLAILFVSKGISQDCNSAYNIEGSNLNFLLGVNDTQICLQCLFSGILFSNTIWSITGATTIINYEVINGIAVLPSIDEMFFEDHVTASCANHIHSHSNARFIQKSKFDSSYIMTIEHYVVLIPSIEA